MASERYILQISGELAESRLLARASFLTWILRLRPNVVVDFWNTVFPEFKRTVMRRFHSEIFEGIDLERFQKEKEAEFTRSPKTCGDYLMHLLQRKLSPGHIGFTEPNLVRHEFFCYEGRVLPNPFGNLA